jgi:nicotinamidase-related amidase
MEYVRGLAVPRTLEEACDPRRLALVVYDMQVGILQQLAGRDRVIGQVSRVVEAARSAGVRTVFMRHVTLPTALMGASQFRMWRSWQRAERAANVVSPFPPQAPHTQLAPGLTPNPDEAVFHKVTMSAFEGTPLDIVLRDCGVGAVAIVGVALEIGVEPTARHAADLGYVPIVVTDACGAGDAVAGERTLAALAFTGDAILTDVDEFTAALASAGDHRSAHDHSGSRS